MAKKMRKVRVVKRGKRRIVARAKKKPAVQPLVRELPPQVAQQAVRPGRLPANPDLVVVEDTVIQMMLADPRFMAAIPCLQAGKKALSSVGKRCGRCSRRRTMLRRKAFNTTRRCLANLQGPERANMKKLLGAKKVRVILQGGKQHVTF